MRSAVGKLRYHASNGDVSIVDSKTGGQQGDPFEMLAYAASVHPVLGSILAKFQDDASAAAYADDLYLTGKLRAILPLLAHLNEVVPADTGMSFNLEKTRILVKDLLPADVHNTAKSLIESDDRLHTLRALVDRPEVFVADGIITVGVPLGTDAFVTAYVANKCQEISADIDKLDPLTDGFVHYQLVRFCQATRLQYLNAHIPKYDLTSYQQAQVDCKITDAILKKGTSQQSEQWSAQDKAWMRMRLQDSHAEGGFGITPNALTRLSAFYSSTARFVQWGGQLGDVAQSTFFPSTDLTDPATWHAPTLTRLRDIHTLLLSTYQCQHAPAPASPAPSQPAPPPSSQPSASPPTGVLVLAQLHQLASNAQPSSAVQIVTSLPTQRRLTRQLVQHHPPFITLRSLHLQNRPGEQQKLQTAQKYRAVADDSALRGEMQILEPQAQDAEPRNLFYSPLSFLAQITSHSQPWPLDLWQTFISTSLGAPVPILVHHPRTLCACRKHNLGNQPDHVQCCPSVGATTQAHDWAITQLQPLFRSLGHAVRVQTAVTASKGNQRGDVEIKDYLRHNGVDRTLVFDFSMAHDRWGATDEPSKNGQLCYPHDLNRTVREAAQKKVKKYQGTYANDHGISFLPAIASTTGRLDADFLRLLFWHAHRESEEFSRLTGQLAQPNPDAVHSKRAAFFNSLKSKIGHIVAKASAMRVNLNLSPAIPSPPRPRPNTSHAPLLYALNLSHHVLPPQGA